MILLQFTTYAMFMKTEDKSKQITFLNFLDDRIDGIKSCHQSSLYIELTLWKNFESGCQNASKCSLSSKHRTNC